MRTEREAFLGILARFVFICAGDDETVGLLPECVNDSTEKKGELQKKEDTRRNDSTNVKYSGNRTGVGDFTISDCPYV